MKTRPFPVGPTCLKRMTGRSTACARGLLSLLLLCAMPAAVQAQFEYSAVGGTVAITRYTGPGGEVTIPDTIEGLPVTSIEERAFEGCTSLNTVTIGNRVTSIGWATFLGCSSLTNLTIANGVASIGGWAFSGCSGLTSVTLPNSVTSITEGCSGEGRPGMPSHYGTFEECTSLTSIRIPDTVTSIGSYAFANCTELSDITFGNAVSGISHEAFAGCTSLTGVTIPNSVTSIGIYAFVACSGLSSVTVGNGVTSIGEGAFEGCTSLTSITIPSSVTGIYEALRGCQNLTHVYFEGDAPLEWPFGDPLSYPSRATSYYLPGTAGWGAEYGSRPTALWVRPEPVILDFGPSFGLQINGFGFIISWATNANVVVEATTDLASSTWSAVSTNTLTDGTAHFTDADWAKYAARLYRVRGE